MKAIFSTIKFSAGFHVIIRFGYFKGRAIYTNLLQTLGRLNKSFLFFIDVISDIKKSFIEKKKKKHYSFVAYVYVKPYTGVLKATI